MNNLKYNIIVGLLRAVACLPLGVLYVVSDVLAFVAHRVMRYRLKVVRKNLRNALPERSPQELRRIEREFYRYLCDCIVETVKLLHISDEELQRRIEFRNVDVVNRPMLDGRHVILYLGHYGNWEWVQATSMIFSGNDISCEIYRPLRNKTMDRVIRRIRSRFGTLCIPQQKAVRTLLKLNADGKRFIVGFISDQYPNNRNRRHWTDFLNQRASYVTGGEEIGRHVDAKFAYLEVDRPRRGHYVMTFKPVEPPADSTEEYPHTLMFLRMFEEHIRRAPEYWLWSHNRWHHKEPVHEPAEPAESAGPAAELRPEPAAEPKEQ